MASRVSAYWIIMLHLFAAQPVDLNGSLRSAAPNNLEFHLPNLLIIYEKCFDLLEHCRIEIVDFFELGIEKRLLCHGAISMHSTKQPGKSGSSVSTSTSRGSPSSDLVEGTKDDDTYQIRVASR